jgi:hypothetical protein
MSKYSSKPSPIIPLGFTPFIERENTRDDGTGLLDHTKVVRNEKECEVTYFDIIQTALQNCIPPVKLHYAGAWSDEAQQSNATLRARRADLEISDQDVFDMHTVGVYIKDPAVQQEP